MYEKEKKRHQHLSDAFNCVTKLYDNILSYQDGLLDDEEKLEEYETYTSKLKKLAEAALMHDEDEVMQRLEEMLQPINQKLDSIDQKTNKLLSEISSIKRQNISIDEKIDKSTEVLRSEFESLEEDVAYLKKKKEIEKLYPWLSKLDADSRCFFETAEYHLEKSPNDSDFSGVNLGYAKAVENEINEKLIIPFIENIRRSKPNIILELLNDDKDTNGWYEHKISLILDPNNDR